MSVPPFQTLTPPVTAVILLPRSCSVNQVSGVLKTAKPIQNPYWQYILLPPPRRFAFKSIKN
jgi:hypothetical protein